MMQLLRCICPQDLKIPNSMALHHLEIQHGVLFKNEEILHNLDIENPEIHHTTGFKHLWITPMLSLEDQSLLL